jgi:hypothetical protein
VFENGKIDVRIAALGDKPVTVDLPRIELRDIGGNGGATPAEIAKTVVTALAQETPKSLRGLKVKGISGIGAGTL